QMLRQYVKRYVEGFDVADINTVSVKALYNEWSNKDQVNYRVEGGYNSVVSFLEDECRKNECDIHVSSPVTRVEWTNNNVVAYTKDNTKYKADKIIMAVPVGILQKRSNNSS